MSRSFLWIGCLTGLWLTLGSSSALIAADEFDAAALEFFEKQVRPILVSRCYECHSSKLKEPKGGLLADSRAALLKGGETGPAIVPGKPKEGLFVEAINYGETYQMPPKGKLPTEEIATLTKWVEMGAPWPKEEGPAALTKEFDLARRKAEHWCWQPLKQPELPKVKNEAWIKQPLDRFILTKLEAAGLPPALPADKRTLIRRIYFDLIGLPPTPEEVEAFLKDDSPQAFESVVNRLLESPHFGERWGRHWLDLMRYAESRGHEFDYSIPGVWQYRDYVIRALNADVPYDQFMTEHVAGDLIQQPRVNPEHKFNESILGTGFWFFGEWIHSPVDIRKDETDRFDNQLDVFSKTFLGLTVTCARCHDHKFDAISQKDYYALAGYLKSSSHRLVRFETQLAELRIAREVAELDSVYRTLVGDAIADDVERGVREAAKYLLAVREVKQTGKTVNDVAGVLQLSPSRLDAWLKVVAEALKEPTHPLHLWALVAEAKSMDSAELQKLLTALAASQPATAYEGEVIADYGNLQRGQWFSDGVTFGLFPALPGQLRFTLSGEQVNVDVQLYGAARRDPQWNDLAIAGDNEVGRLGFPRAGRTLKTRSFVIKSGPVHYLVKGAGQVYAAVDTHTMINGPLHGSLVRETGGDGNTPPRWITHDLKPYIGHTAHLEFTPKGNEDLQILAVAQGDKAPPLPYPLDRSVELVRHLSEPQTKSLAALAEMIQQRFQDGLLALQTGTTDPTTRQLTAQFVQLLLAQPALWKDGQSDPPYEALLADYRAARQKRTANMPTKSALAVAMWDGSGVDEYLLIRGNSSQRTQGPIVPRRLLEAIEMDLGAAAVMPPMSETVGIIPPSFSGSGRSRLAAKLTDPRNPFPSRVMINRIWHHLLGRGIVPSVDNFGVLGQAPTHPELLDQLALEFMADGWSIKRAIKRIALSSTYQMSSGGTMHELDPLNELYHQAPIRRLEGEVIRDSILRLSGRLDRKLYGPSVPVHLTAFMQGRGRPGSGPLDGDGRRSIYLGIRRNFLSPMMLAFDTPIPFSTVGRRNTSNVPAQALILMNDPFVMEQAKLWAKKLHSKSSLNSEDRIRSLYDSAFGRPPSSAELTAAQEFLNNQAAEYGVPADKAATDERGWADLCHVLLNSKEFVFVR